MNYSCKRANEVTTGIWLIGLGILIYTGYWWPGIMFVIGASTIAQGLVDGRGWYAFQGGLWTIGIGVWAIFHFNIAIFFVVLGVSVLLGALVKGPSFSQKPVVDNSLE